MGRFSVNEADNYGNSSSSSFFSLKGDGDVARVRFMYNNMEDVSGYAVHQVEVDGKRRFVNCLRSYNEPKSKCPLCESGNFQRARLYIPLYVYTEKDKDGNYSGGEVQLWERGKNFFAKISGVCARYASGNTPLVSSVFEIERHGKPNDTGTQYEIFKVGEDDTTLEDLPEVPEVIGTVILDKSKDELEYYAEEGQFPSTAETDMPARRGHSEFRNEGRPTGRRTPSRDDAF